MWAVGGDRQIYVHVHGLDIPIRIKEEAYENEVRSRRQRLTASIIYLNLLCGCVTEFPDFFRC
jgi:hypothetical protein